MRKLPSLLLLLLATCQPPTQQLVGSWQWRKTTYISHDTAFTWTDINGRLIFTNKDYSLTFIDEEGPRASLKPGGWDGNSKEDLQRTLDPFHSNAGIYEVKGDSVFLFRQIALWPSAMSKEARPNRFGMKWSSDTLILTLRNPNGSTTVDYWTKRD